MNVETDGFDQVQASAFREARERPCVRHSDRLTVISCGRCGDAICTQCMIQTPVGARCRSCARMSHLPQHDVSPVLLGRASIVGLGTSSIGWYATTYVPFLRFFLAVGVGAAVGEMMSRVARRRNNRSLEVLAVLVVVLGLVVAVTVTQLGSGQSLQTLGRSTAYAAPALIPAVIASAVAVIKLR